MSLEQNALSRAESGHSTVQENEEAGQFVVQARITLDALESNSGFLSNVETPRKPQCPQQEEKIIIVYKKKMIKKWKRPFSSLKKRLHVYLRLGLETEETTGKVASWEFPKALSLLTKDWVRSIDARTQVVGRLRHKYENHYEDMCCNCRHYCD